MKLLFKLLPTLIALSFISPGMAQDTYLHIGGGYGFRNASDVLGGFYNNTLNLQSYEESQVLMSLGGGTNLDIGIVAYGDNGGGFSFRYSYLFGSAIQSTEISNVSVVSKEIHNSLSGRYSRIIAAYTLRGEINKTTPYMQIGPVLSWGKASWDQTEDLGVTTNETSWEYTGGFTAGVTASAGIMIETGAITRFFIEATAYSLSWSPEKKIMTKAVVDGDDVLEAFPLSVREIHYESERTIDYNNPPSEHDPDVQLKFSLPMSSIGIQAGIRLLL